MYRNSKATHLIFNWWMLFILPIVYGIDANAQVNEFNSRLSNLRDLSKFRDSSRVGAYKNKVGKYNQILNTNKTVINPGDTIVVDYFISGYGSISAAKLFLMPTTDIFDEDSFGIDGLVLTPDGENFRYTTDTIPIYGGQNVILFTTAIVNNSKKYYQSVFHSIFPLDRPKNYGALENTEIATEIYDKTKESMTPPFQFYFIAKEKIPPGEYKINFAFNYYNGSNFETDLVVLDVKVMAWYERQAHEIQWLGYILTVLTLIGILYTGIKFINNKVRLFKKRRRRKKKK